VLQKGKSTFVYASEVFNSRIRGFKVQTSGALTELPSSPYAAGALPVALASAAGKVFGIQQTAGAITNYRVTGSGALVSAFSTPVGGTNAFTLYTDPKGKTVYVPENTGGNEVLAFKVGKTSFTPVNGSPFASDVATSSGLVFGTPFLFAMPLTNSVGNDLQVYRRSSKGALQKLQVQSSGLQGVRSGAVSKKRLVLASDDSNVVRSYTIGTDGGLTVVDTEAAEITFANQVLILRR
jgi:hypothetical protein